MFLQLPHPGADAVNAIFADPSQPLGGIVPFLRQGEHEGEQALRFQRERLVPQVVVGHHRIITGFLNAEYRHIGYLLPSVLKSVRFGGFAPLYRRPASHEGKNMGGFICAAHRRKTGDFPPVFIQFHAPSAGHKKTPQVCVTYGVAPADGRSVFSYSLLTPRYPPSPANLQRIFWKCESCFQSGSSGTRRSLPAYKQRIFQCRE